MYYIYSQSVMRYMKILSTILLTLFLLGCSKYEIEKIEGNTPPIEQIVTEELRESYVNRIYITLAGRKATPQEFEAGINQLGEKAEAEDRRKFIQSIFTLSEYFHEMYKVARGDYLEGVDTATIGDDYRLAVWALQNAMGNEREYWLMVEAQLGPMVQISEQLLNDEIDIREVHRRAVNNIYYDDINMGSENYVVATFQNFLFRYPTNVELENAKQMVDGFPSSVFLETGGSRDDFINIFFDTDDYYEGQVINLYRKYLFRDPETEEMVELTKEYQGTGDYQALQTTILTNDEYFFN